MQLKATTFYEEQKKKQESLICLIKDTKGSYNL